MSNFQPPPTWALPVIVEPATGRSIFNPIWLKWFVDLGAGLTAAGAGSLAAASAAVGGHFAVWQDATATYLIDGGVVGSAAHAATSDFIPASDYADFLPVTGVAADSAKLAGSTWASPSALGTTTPAAVKGTTVQVTTGGGYKTSDGAAGYTGTLTTASLVGKTVTIKDGIITGIS